LTSADIRVPCLNICRLYCPVRFTVINCGTVHCWTKPFSVLCSSVRLSRRAGWSKRSLKHSHCLRMYIVRQ